MQGLPGEGVWQCAHKKPSAGLRLHACKRPSLPKQTHICAGMVLSSPCCPIPASQGGSTTFTSGLKFIQDGLPALASWSWTSMGYFLDTDGTLLNPSTLPPADLPAGWSLGPGCTLHSAVETDLFDVPECVYLTTSNGAYCKPDLTFRRLMLNNHSPQSLFYRCVVLCQVMLQLAGVPQ